VLTERQVADALKHLGNYRVLAAQHVANENTTDGISGGLMLSLGMRESLLQNINNKAQTDKGCFQITELYHLAWLKSQPGCPEGQWRPQPGRTADEDGFCPRYTPALEYALQMLQDAVAYAKKRSIKDPVRFAVAAYNAGIGGALRGYQEGDVDKYTTGGDYSAWVLKVKPMVQHWIAAHPSWQSLP
jgi:hypothetical protein